MWPCAAPRTYPMPAARPCAAARPDRAWCWVATPGCRAGHDAHDPTSYAPLELPKIYLHSRETLSDLAPSIGRFVKASQHGGQARGMGRLNLETVPWSKNAFSPLCRNGLIIRALNLVTIRDELVSCQPSRNRPTVQSVDGARSKCYSDHGQFHSTARCTPCSRAWAVRPAAASGDQ